MRLRRPLVPSLQLRIALVFAFGTLVLSAALSFIAYTYSRGYLTGQLEATAQRQTFENARLVRDGLRPGNVDVTSLLTSVEAPSGAESVVEYRGRWYASSLAEGRAVLPTGLVEVVARGRPAQQRFALAQGTQLAIGVPLPEVRAAYFSIFPLHSLASTLHGIAVSLLIAAAATTFAGALLGFFTSRRLARPVLEVARASTRIAEGRLETRLPGARDRELATLARAFNDMADALQHRIERDARFVADVSHELRSPLTTLAVTLSVLEARRQALPERGREALDLLAQDVRRFQRLVDDLLEIGRSDLAAVDTTFQPVNLAELVLRFCQEQLPADVPVQIDAAVMDRRALVDKRRLERVLANLFDNAARHAGGVRSVRLDGADHSARISVEDHGPGVPQSDRERIFERFARSSGNRQRTEGSGLGLALAREHARLHNGRVWVEDAEPGGARFVVELPVLDA